MIKSVGLLSARGSVVVLRQLMGSLRKSPAECLADTPLAYTSAAAELARLEQPPETNHRDLFGVDDDGARRLAGVV